MSLIKKLLGKVVPQAVEIPKVEPTPKKKIKKPAVKKTVNKPSNKVNNKTESKKSNKNPAQSLTEKEIATQKGEPYVKVVNFEISEGNVGDGAFELDFNEFFVAKLVKAGFKGDTDEKIVDNWFSSVCRNIALEMWEQYQADPANRKSDLGNGYSEIS